MRNYYPQRYQCVNIENYLKQFSHQEIIYIPNYGNAGDSLISASTYFLLNKYHIKYTALPLHPAHPSFNEEIQTVIQTVKGKIVFYGGGGNLVRYYHGADKIIRNLVNHCERLIVLPHSIEGHYSLLYNLPTHVEIFCREIKSYQYVKSVGIQNVYLCNDLAFNFDYNYWIKKSKKEIGNFFREDKEKTALTLKQDNVDVSNIACKNIVLNSHSNEEWQKKCADAFLKYIADYKRVNTNRLHVAIAATKLGKKVNFYPNNYWKNEAVYTFSMKNKYRNVRFISKGKDEITPTVEIDKNLSNSINRLFIAQFPNRDLKDFNQVKNFYSMTIAAWNYAITKDYAIFKSVLEHSNNQDSIKFIESSLTELVERKELVFLNDNRIITNYRVIPTESNGFTLIIDF